MALLRSIASRVAGARWAVAAALLLLGGAASSPSAAAAQSSDSGEYPVKAAFLYNFAKFVEWPESALSRQAPFRICVLGTDPFGPTLDELVRGERLGARPFTVERLAAPVEPGHCQILYVAADTRPEVRRRLFAGDHSATLTVGEDDDFLSRGGLIRFRLEQRRVRFAVNLEATDRSRLRISSKLLRLAEVVRP